jgi:phage terminase large subunit-like protein
MFWTHDCIAPWQTERWIAEMRRSLRPNQFLRMIENRFVSGETTFIDMSKWDACVVPGLGSSVENRLLPIYVGVDASVKHDSTAIVAVAYDDDAKVCRLIFHRVFTPTPEQPIDFALVEATLLDLSKRFLLRRVLCDPFQLASTMQRLAQQGLPVEEFPQSVPNLTAASQNLFELIQSQSLVCYPDAGMRLAVSRAIALETPRGWRISKEKQAHKIDVVIALMLACHAAIVAQSEPFFDHTFQWVSGPADADDPYNTKSWQALRNALYVGSGGMTKLW